jgi:hypothetical protein
MKVVKRRVVDYDWGDNQTYRFHVWFAAEFKEPPEEVHDPGLGGPLGGYLVDQFMTRDEADAFAAGRPSIVITENPHWRARRN